MRVAQSTNTKEMLEILKKPWLGTGDIKKLASVGTNKALEIKANIAKQLLEQNYFLPTGLVPTDKVVEYLHLNIRYLKSMTGGN